MRDDEIIKLVIGSKGLLSRLQLSINARLIITSGLCEITASVASELLGMSPSDSNRPIKELVDKGFLVRTGGDRKNGYIYSLV